MIARAIAQAQSLSEEVSVPVAAPSAPKDKTAAISVETFGMTKRFGSFTALEDVSIKVGAGTFHALLGENGAGKSTLVKCIMGFYRPTEGAVLVDGRELTIANPRDAHQHGLGMVYQHFTLIPSLTAAENLVLSRSHVPAVIDWRKERKALEAFLETMPFRIPLDRPVSQLAAGQKQKLEILKQIYLKSRFLILDEPTSVLTPGEAEEVLGLLKAMTDRGEITVFMISHKFREVMAFAEDVSVLRKGKLAGQGKVADLTRDDMAAMMIGSREVAQVATRQGVVDTNVPVLQIKALKAKDQTGTKAITIDELIVHSREIVGIAGVSGNGQKELAEVLAGQRPAEAGDIMVDRSLYAATRAETREAPGPLHSRGAAQERLRSAHGGGGKPCVSNLRCERRRKASLLVEAEGDTLKCAHADRAVQREDGLDGLAHRDAFWRQRAARGACPRADRRGRSPGRRQSLLRARFLRRRRDSFAHRGGAERRRGGAPDQRGPRRDPRALGSHARHVGRADRL